MSMAPSRIAWTRLALAGLLSGGLFGCIFESREVAGGTTDSGNAVVLGRVVFGGQAVADASIRIRPADFLAGESVEATRRADTRSDSVGRFSARIATHQDYALEVRKHDSLVRRVILPASALASGEIDLDTVTLAPGARLLGAFDTSIQVSGTVRVEGLESQSEIGPDGVFAFISLPEGEHRLVCEWKRIGTGGGQESELLEIPNLEASAGKTTRIEAIHPESGTWTLVLPDSFVADSLALAAFLASQGILEGFDFPSRTRSVDGRLRTLILDSLALADLHPDIGNLDFLWTLSLAKNHLTRLPPTLARIRHLSSLNADGNALTEVPVAIGSLRYLQFLKVSQNRLNALPDTVFSLSLLRKLAIAQNHFTELPTALGRLKMLEMLDIFGNPLSALPDAIGELPALQQIWANNMALTGLPAGITRLMNLEVMQLNGNKLAALPEDFGNLAALRDLQLYDNQLSALPASITALPSLQSLNVGKNRLCTVAAELAQWIQAKSTGAWESSQQNCP